MVMIINNENVFQKNKILIKYSYSYNIGSSLKKNCIEKLQRIESKRSQE